MLLASHAALLELTRLFVMLLLGLALGGTGGYVLGRFVQRLRTRHLRQQDRNRTPVPPPIPSPTIPWPYAGIS